MIPAQGRDGKDPYAPRPGDGPGVTVWRELMSGALGQKAPELSMAAGYGTSPFFVFSGYDGDGEYFQFVELLFVVIVEQFFFIQLVFVWFILGWR